MVAAKTLVIPKGLRGARAHGHRDGRAVGVGDDCAVPAAILALDRNQPEMIGVDFGDQQRHVGIHAVIARVGDNQAARRGESLLDGAGDRGIHGGEHQPRRVSRRGGVNDSIRNRGGDVAVERPTGGFAVGFARAAFAGAEPGEIEPGVAL